MYASLAGLSAFAPVGGIIGSQRQQMPPSSVASDYSIMSQFNDNQRALDSILKVSAEQQQQRMNLIGSQGREGWFTGGFGAPHVSEPVSSAAGLLAGMQFPYISQPQIPPNLAGTVQ